MFYHAFAACRFEHAVASPETELRFGVVMQDTLHQLGAMQVAGGFAYNNIIFHTPTYAINRVLAVPSAPMPAVPATRLSL